MQNLSSADRFRLLAQHADLHALIVLDQDGVIVEWSPGAERLLGWPAAEALGQPLALIFMPHDRAVGAPAAEMAAARELGHSADIRWHQRKDGATVFCDGTITAIHDPQTHALLGFGKIMRAAYGIDPRHGPASAGGQEQRPFVAALLESVENGVIACDRQGRLTLFNQGACAIHELPFADLRYTDWAGFYHLYREDGVTPLPLQEIPLYRALQGELVDGAVIVVRTPGGGRKQVQVRARPILDADGQIQGAVASMLDISVHRAARDARERAQREQDLRLLTELSEARLRKAEEQLRLATEAAQLGIWTWDATHDHATWENPRMYEIFRVRAGRTPVGAEALMRGYLAPEDAARFRQALDATLTQGERFHFAGRFQVAGADQPRWVELTGIRQLTDGLVMIIGTAEDITERKNNEEALRQARLRFEATLAAAEVASWIWEIPRDRVVADTNLTRLFGVPDELAQAAPLHTYTGAIHPDDLDKVQQEIARAMADRGMYSATYRVRAAGGEYRWVIARGRVMYDADGQPEVLTGVTLDITSQKELQDALRLTDERYRTLIASMDEAFGIVQVLLDADGQPVDYRFEEVNQAMQQQSGLVDAAGKTIREMVPDIEQRWIDIYGRVALTREPVRFTEHSAAMGYWWDVYATPIGAADEHRIAILFTDVTAKRRSEQDLRRVAAELSEANRRKTEFLATLAHELRNPLAPIRTGLELLQRAPDAPAAGARVLAMMGRQLKHMVHLIDDLLEVSRISSGKIALKIAPVPLADAVANAVDSVRPAIDEAGHQLHVDLPAAPVVLDADATRLAQVLSNLLTNAVKYTPPGGIITLRALTDARSVHITVADNGIGIPPSEQPRVFDMFSQVARNIGHAQGGLGIGLALVRSLVDMQGGSVSVASAGAGHGSSFTVTLPLRSGAADSAAPAGAATPGPASALQVVIADDNRDAAEALGMLLECEGHTVLAVHDGEAALAAIATTRPRLALLDIGMPGMNGYEVARAVRQDPALGGVVLAALTGWGGEQDRERSRAAGFDHHLVKPINLETLRQLAALCGAAAT